MEKVAAQLKKFSFNLKFFCSVEKVKDFLQ
jgi:hypothetical protein